MTNQDNETLKCKDQINSLKASKDLLKQDVALAQKRLQNE